ncbi:MAG TPA: acyltransferase family protein [Solirubrobacteraceae bacterium]|nr:acyltransferase family protein [Solirubrobacteraceae bacterium]
MSTVTAEVERHDVVARDAHARSPTKRLDIQGLRALAVLLVALNHANVPFLKGGYVGVDVFFVVSGYLITGILLREGFGPRRQVSVGDFYARRARRILPAATLTLVVTSVAVYIVYDVDRADFLQTKVVLLDALSASLFYANVHLASTATNYFAQAATTFPSPFQHFWSLSVEEQFYFVWAPALLLLFFTCRRMTPRATARVVGVVIATACVASLAWSIHDTSTSPQSAYFSTFDRAWELGLGAMLALLAGATPALPQRFRETLGWAGCAMIAAAALLYSGSTPFPGYEALLPVVGAGLIIVAGITSTRVGADRMLSVRPLNYVGDRSYAFYLWHFPVLILAWQLAGRELPVATNLVLLAGALMLSIFTYKFWENRLRFSRYLRTRKTAAAMAAVCIAACLTAVLVPIGLFNNTLAAEAKVAAKIHPKPLGPPPSSTNPNQIPPSPTSLWNSAPIPAVQAAVTQVRHNLPLPKQITPSAQVLARENSTGGGADPTDCLPAFGPGVTAKVCRLGDAASKQVIVEIGDSQAGTWMGALRQVAQEEHLAVVPLVKPGCFVTRVYTNSAGWPCAAWFKWALGWDHRLHPVATFVNFLFAWQFEDKIARTTGYFRSVLSQVTNGVYLADHPRQDVEPTDCIYKPHATMGECSARVTSSYIAFMKSMQAMAAKTHHPSIPTMQWFCGEGICPMVINHTVVSRDKDHMTQQYSKELAPLLDAEVERVLAQLHPKHNTQGVG